jgi:integrase
MALKKITHKNGDTKWEIRVYEDGRSSKRIKRVFDRKVDAEEFLLDYKKQQKEKAANPFKTSSFQDRKFQDEAEYWLKDGEMRFSEGHLIRVRGVLRELYPQMGDWTIDRFTPEALGKYQQQEKKKGLSNSTVNRKTEIITAILNCSAKHRRIPFNPTIGFSKLKRSSVEMAFWNENEAKSFLTKMDELYPSGHPKRWVYIAYMLALNSGLRAGEIWGLQPMDISLDGKSIWIRRQFNRVSKRLGETKGKKARYVPCPQVLTEELRKWIGKNGFKPNETIFQNEQGKPICHDNFSNRQFGKDLKVWGGRSIRFHDLRHTATTLLIAMGVDIKTVKEVCGHADISTTMNYVHMVAGAVEKLSEIFVLSSSRKEDEGARLALVKEV